MDELLTLEHFTPHVGKLVRFRDTDFAFPIDRIEGGKPPPGWLRVPFLVIFRGPRDGRVLPEGFYVCEIEGGPTYDMYVAPIHTPAPGSQEYQAAFN